jgi:hypothetical protein
MKRSGLEGDRIGAVSYLGTSTRETATLAGLSLFFQYKKLF